MLAIVRTRTCSNHDKAAGMNNSQRSGLMPAAIPIADAKAMSGGTTDIRYMEKTHDNAKGSENFIPENQFLLLHSHISPKFRYMRVLSRFGAHSVSKRARTLDHLRQPHIFHYFILQRFVTTDALKHGALHQKEPTDADSSLRLWVTDAVKQTKHQQYPSPGRYHYALPK